MNVFDLPNPDTSTVLGAWISWPCTHRWRRLRRHPAYHGYWAPSVQPSDSTMTLRWDATGRATINLGPEPDFPSD